MISSEEFKNIDLRVGKILAAEKIANSDKLLRLLVSLGDEDRQIIAGIGGAYAPENLIGKEVAVLANIAPREIMGFQSKGMLLACDADEPILLMPEREVPPGKSIR